jgi:hypothetical protein
MSGIHRVRDVTEAVQLASEFRNSGRYDWFRGQLQNWPLKSSFARLTRSGQEDALDKVARLEQWAKETQGLESLTSSIEGVSNIDGLVAVAQHYGLPTNYIDFTTSPEIAGFFATDNPKSHPLEKESCIMCLNTGDLRDFWTGMPPKYPAPEFIQLEVPNLWRLEAQEGCFLFCPYGDFENLYDLDRILFPGTGSFSGIQRTRIYPPIKSALEIALDRYFMNETLIAGTRTMESLSGFRNASHVTVEDTGGWNPDLVKGPIPVHPSWHPSLIKTWIETGVEKYSHVASGPTLTITLPQERDPSHIRADIALQVSSSLAGDKSLRTHSVVWNVAGTESISSARPALRVLPPALTRLWDGLRVLPYPDAALAFSIGQCVALWLAWDEPRQAAGTCFGDSLEIGFGSADSAYSTAFASKATLLRAVRDDIDHWLPAEYAGSLRGHIAGLLQAVPDPSRLFDFSRLADAFVTQIAPFQVLHRRSDSAVFYSPALLDRFGLP